MAARRRTEPSEQLPAPTSFLQVLEQVGSRPEDLGEQKTKKNYAETLSNRLAVWLAAKLRAVGDFPGIRPHADGTGRETTVASGKGKKPKKTDVRYSTPDTGLELLVSVKTYSFRDVHTDKPTGVRRLGRYSRNMVRNDHELRAEAMDIHERFPYAVLVAVMFLPFRACEDAGVGKGATSSFASAVKTFRHRGGRIRPSDPYQLFEGFFIGLYDHEGASRGQVQFFDVMESPPRRGRPAVLIDEAALVREIVKAYGTRNRLYIDYADDVPDAPLLQPENDEDDEDEEEPEA
jgi:hypothetical protein